MTASQQLTARQRQVFEFVQLRSQELGAAPTLEEICSHFGFKSTNAAREHLRLIQQKGYLERWPNRARAIRVIHGRSLQSEVVGVPLVGRIAAGSPIDATEEVEAVIPLPRAFWRGNKLFALRVRGDSMAGAGIFNGDIAIVNVQADVADGEIAAIVVGEDATLKRLFRTDSGVCLRAENPIYEDQIFDRTRANEIRVAGVLVGILRTF